MSVFTFQYGQCGNQIGQNFFDNLYEDILYKNERDANFNQKNVDYYTDSLEKWFSVNTRGVWESRNFLIDTEDKVTGLLSKNKNYRCPNVIAKPFGGAGNNWAFGFSQKSKLLLPEVMEAVRKESEKCDFISSFMNVLSSAGGTGSGVGSKIINYLHDQFSSKIIVNVVVLPYTSGEVVTQNYNNLLTLSSLYSETDAVMLFENDRIHYTCNKLLNIQNTKFSDINRVITNQLMSLAQPIGDLSLSNVVTILACHPSYKFLQMKTAPLIKSEYANYEPVENWTSIFKSVIRNRYDSDIKPEFQQNKSLGNILLTRGGCCPSGNEVKLIKDDPIYASWLPKQSNLTKYHQNRELYNFPKLATLVSNSQFNCINVDRILQDAWDLFTSRAYLHHYEKFEIGTDYFLECFEQMETVVQNYASL